MTIKNNDEMFEDYPQDFIDKIDDLKGKVKKVSYYETVRFGCDEIESPSGMASYKLERNLDVTKKR